MFVPAVKADSTQVQSVEGIKHQLAECRPTGGQQGGQSSLHVRHGSRSRVAEVQLIELVTGQGLGDRQQAQALTVQV